MDLFRSMAVFVSIADKGSLTAAGEEHRISATMVGNHLQMLEARLGVRLLHRTTRRQSLTEFGRSYYEQCLEILRLVADADANALTTRARPSGRLRITAPVSFGAERLMPALGEYLARYPDVSVDLALNDRIVDLVEEGYEAAIRTAGTPDPTLVSYPLVPYRMMICASPDYIHRRGEPREPNDLLRHDCLTFSHGSKTWRLKGPDGVINLQVREHLQVNNGQALRVAALNGLGIILQPEVIVSADIASGRLAQILPEYGLPARPMYLVHLPDHRISSKLKSFVDFAISQFGVDKLRKSIAFLPTS